jgi:hypothetical protein
MGGFIRKRRPGLQGGSLYPEAPTRDFFRRGQVLSGFGLISSGWDQAWRLVFGGPNMPEEMKSKSESKIAEAPEP